MWLRNRLLGGVSFAACLAPEGVGGGGGDDDHQEKHTDVVLQELAARAFDDVAARTDDGGERRPAGKPAGAEKTAATERELSDGGKRTGERQDPGDRGDGRTPKGTFAKKTPAESEAERVVTGGDGKPDPAAKAGEQQLGQEQQQQDAPKVAPPGGWSPTSKAAWDKLPESVRADIAKREVEVSAGFKAYEGVKPFAARAEKGGQTLAQALTAYTGIEDMIRQDFPGGVLHIARNAGLTQHEAATHFAKLAQRLGYQFSAPGAQTPGGSPGDQKPGAGPDGETLQQLLRPVLEPIMQQVKEMSDWRTQTAEGEKTQRRGAADRVVQTFRQDPAHKYYDNVEQTIGDLLERGVVPRTGDPAADLKAAYETACWQNPEIRELLIKERTAATGDQQRNDAQAETLRKRAASRSVTGAPAPGVREQPRRNGTDRLQSAAEQAFDQVAGRV